MSNTPNMLSAIEPWDLVANAYAGTTMQMLAHYADEAIAASNLKSGARILMEGERNTGDQIDGKKLTELPIRLSSDAWLEIK